MRIGTLATLALLLTALAACGDPVERQVEKAVEQTMVAKQVQATLSPTATPTPRPTQTWQQWLGQQMANSQCPTPGSIMLYRNESRTPPYRADFFCQKPTPEPTPTPRDTPTPWPTPTPRDTQIETTTFTVKSGNSYEVRLPAAPGDGYVNYQFSSKEDGYNKPLDIDFNVRSSQLGVVAYTGRTQGERSRIPVSKGERLTMHFDNGYSVFAGKTVTLSYYWSARAR